MVTERASLCVTHHTCCNLSQINDTEPPTLRWGDPHFIHRYPHKLCKAGHSLHKAVKIKGPTQHSIRQEFKL